MFCRSSTYCYVLVPPLHFPRPLQGLQRPTPVPTHRYSPPEDITQHMQRAVALILYIILLKQNNMNIYTENVSF